MKPSLDYAISYLTVERRRLATERDVANNNKDYETAKKCEWLVNGLDHALEVLEEKNKES
jgi:hypothetical protein